jgi:peptidyl-prolyl cis-trans isomerase A (cyclophilin A)
MKTFTKIIYFIITGSIILMTNGCKQETSTLLLKPDQAELNKQAPDQYQIKFETTKGDFVVEVYRDWSPRGADRLYFLIKNGFYNDARFFRVIAGFMAQFGYHGNPDVSKVWTNMTFPDDPPNQSNLRGYLTFAKRGDPDSRSTNLFINLVDNPYLDNSGFTPLGKVVGGMNVVDQLYSGYGEGAPNGRGPNQGRIQEEGNEYLTKSFPKLDYIRKAEIISE